MQENIAKQGAQWGRRWSAVNGPGFQGVVGWCDGAGLTSSAGAPYNWITVGQGLTALAVGADGCCLDIFTLIYPFSSLSPSLWETARYSLKYCLKGPLNPKQPTNQPWFHSEIFSTVKRIICAHHFIILLPLIF